MSDTPTRGVDGRSVTFEVNGEKREIHCYRCEDGDGYYFVFMRGKTDYPLRLSHDGVNAMLAVFHAVAFESQHQSEKGKHNAD